ncbi:MAG: hypothetical protein AOA65_1081 [Candidatus Bathyarchaeota archaeon BA1]|nr:MAG: hypothetical protein AOA65_1081 [Candidatus Bathyarchaeota archaeon BA1]
MQIKNFVISYIGNGFITPLEIEIFEALERDGFIERNKFILKLIEKGYHRRDIEDELERSCYASWTKRLSDGDRYVPLSLGMSVWSDLKERINEQESIIGLNIVRTSQLIYHLTVPYSSFFPEPVKLVIKNYNFKRAPIMQYVAKLPLEKTLCFIKDITHQLTPAKDKLGNHSKCWQIMDFLQIIKTSKLQRVWVVGRVTLDINITDMLVKVMKTIKKIGRKPVDWRGGALVEIKMLYKNIHQPKNEINETLEYLLDKGLIRRVSNTYFTITGMGFFIWKFFEKAVQGYSNFNCIIKKESCENYKLEVCDSSYLLEGVRQIITKYGFNVRGALISRKLSSEDLLSILNEVLLTLSIVKEKARN